MAFNFCTTKRICYVGQYDRIDDLVTFNLRGDERLYLKKILIGEFTSSAVFKCFNPLFIWHFSLSAQRLGSGSFPERRSRLIGLWSVFYRLRRWLVALPQYLSHRAATPAFCRRLTSCHLSWSHLRWASSLL